jgi:hypothetical protein
MELVFEHRDVSNYGLGSAKSLAEFAKFYRRAAIKS